jgi:exonuclease VII small subunit
MAYKIKEKNEDPKLTVIQKTGLTAEYTLADIERNIEQVNRVITELDATLRVNKAKAENVERNHPFVMDLDETALEAARIYAETREYLKQLPERLETARQVLANELKEQDQAKKVLGI